MRRRTLDAIERAAGLMRAMVERDEERESAGLEYWLYHRPTFPGPCRRIAGPWRNQEAALAQKRRYMRLGEHPGEVMLWIALPGEAAPEQIPVEEAHDT